MLIVTLLVGVLIGLLLPRPARFAAPRRTPVIVVAALLHVASIPFDGRLGTGLLTVSIATGLVWLALQPRHLPTVLLGLGVAMNLLVVVANGGMPVDPAALSSVGRDIGDVTGSFFGKHIVMDDDTRFAWLADRIPIPVQRNVVSAGDVVMAAAIALWLGDLVGGLRYGRRSAGSVDGEHRGSPSRELADGDAT